MRFGIRRRRFAAAVGAAVATFTFGAVLLGGTATASPAPLETGVQGDVTNAVLNCFVDTYALDQLRPNQCYGVWRPGTASNPTVAYFEVTGLTAGSYSYAWTDLETGSPACANVHSCSRPIATDVSGDGEVWMSVRVTDLATGAAKTVSARATYLDGWH